MTRNNGNAGAEFDCILIWENFLSNCPEDGRRDRYEIRLRYRPKRDLLELRSLRAYLDSFRAKEMLQEDIANQVFADVTKCAHPALLDVELVSCRDGLEYSVRRTRRR